MKQTVETRKGPRERCTPTVGLHGARWAGGHDVIITPTIVRRVTRMDDPDLTCSMLGAIPSRRDDEVGQEFGRRGIINVESWTRSMPGAPVATSATGTHDSSVAHARIPDPVICQVRRQTASFWKARRSAGLAIVRWLTKVRFLVLAIVRTTFPPASDSADASEASRVRIGAADEAFEALPGRGMRSSSLEEVAAYILAAHGAYRTQFRISGPEVPVSDREAMGFALILNELTINAAKHGALSTPFGGVTLTWIIEGGPDGPVLRVAWSEDGGPPVSTLQPTGFGVAMVGKLVTAYLNGTHSFAFDTTGVRFTMIARLEG